jgi:probable HAF family extracellular repeat protein
MKTKSILVLVSLIILLTLTNLCNAIRYEIIDLGTLGGDSSLAFGINNSGEVVGYSYIQGPYYHAFLYDAKGTMKDLGTLDGTYTYSSAYAINNIGQVVGFAYNASGNRRATRFDSTGNGNNIDLGTLGGNWSVASSINNSGQIVGAGGVQDIDNYNHHAFLYSESIMVDLGTLGGQNSGADGINEAGQIAGSSQILGGMYHAFLYTAGNMIDLGTLGGDYSYAWGINDIGQVVGKSATADGYEHAFIYAEGEMVDLPSLGLGNSQAFGINNSSQIVGKASLPSGARAFLYMDGQMFDLNNLIDPSANWLLQDARSINNNGWIVGIGINPNGYTHAFLLIPEPATPPIADADGPYTIYVGDTLTLDASGSTDVDSDIVSYLWDIDDNNSFETDAGSQAIFDVNYTYLQSLGILVDNTYNIHLKVIDSVAQSDTADSTFTIIPQPALQVVVDIKPRSCPNPLNVKSSGVLPVAILGTVDVNVTEIDPTSIRLEGVNAIRHSFENVAAPAVDSSDCNCTEDGPDGFLDLTLKFKTQEIVNAIGNVNEGDVLVLELTGVLYDERPIEGTDCVLIRGKHKPCNRADFDSDGKVDMADFATFAGNWLQVSIE